MHCAPPPQQPWPFALQPARTHITAPSPPLPNCSAAAQLQALSPCCLVSATSTVITPCQRFDAITPFPTNDEAHSSSSSNTHNNTIAAAANNTFRGSHQRKNRIAPSPTAVRTVLITAPANPITDNVIHCRRFRYCIERALPQHKQQSAKMKCKGMLISNNSVRRILEPLMLYTARILHLQSARSCYG